MIIAISGSVGSGKTTLAGKLSEKLGYEVLHLNDLAEKYKLGDVEELQTFDFDIDALLDDLEEKLQEKDDLIVEGHFAHFIDPEIVDLLIVLNRPLHDLKAEYRARGYNEVKIRDNLEVESFNLCFYEALEEGYEEDTQVFCFDNNGDLNILLRDVLEKINKRER